MNPVEAIVQALRLCVLTISFVLEETRRHEKAIEDARLKRAIFETAVVRALERMRRDAAAENKTVDGVDDAVDRDQKRHS